MNDNLELELKLQAWLDGELSAPEAQRVEREIAGNAQAGRLIAELRAVKQTLAGSETAVAIPETREFYWSKIERQILRKARVPSAPRQAMWLRWLSPLSGVAALACMVLLAVKPFSPPAFDDITSTGEGMEAVTFHDQSAGMTVVWMDDTGQAPLIDTPAVNPPEAEETDVDM